MRNGCTLIAPLIGIEKAPLLAILFSMNFDSTEALPYEARLFASAMASLTENLPAISKVAIKVTTRMQFEFATLLRSIRERRQLTQEDLARELEVTLSTLGNWENARHLPLRAQRRRITELAARCGLNTEPSASARKSVEPSSCEDLPPLTVQVIDFFCGCGGMSYGFKTAKTTKLRFDVLGGIDVDPHALATYRNMMKRPALQLDIRKLVDYAGLQHALSQFQYDRTKPLILIGCAPCQGFSSHRKKDRRQDQRNDLMSAFAEVVAHLMPDLVVIENVPEMLHESHWEHFDCFRKRVATEGYSTRARIHNLAAFGLPQERFRAIALAARDVGKIEMPVPLRKPSEFATVRDAIGHLPRLKAGGASALDAMHVTSKHRQSTINLLKLIPKDGGSRRSLPPGVGPDCHKRVDGFRDVYGRLWWDRPAVAITARCRTPSCGRFTHPEQNRGLSVREAALLQGFPPEFVFEGPFDDKFKQIGNAVSPLFARELARHIEGSWFGEAIRTPQADDVCAPIKKSISSAIAGMKRKSRLLEARGLDR